MLRVFEFMAPGTTLPSDTSPRLAGPPPRAAMPPPTSPRRLDSLHSDILRLVVAKLPILDLLSLACVSKRLHQVFSEDAVWGPFFPIGEPWPSQQLEIHGSWKKVYVAWLRRSVRAWRMSGEWLKGISDHQDKLKIAFFGPRNGGKSVLLTRFVQGVFMREYQPTIGVEFFITSVLIRGSELPYKLQMWDLSGGERFRFVARNYYRGVRVGVFVYRATVTYTDSAFDMIADFLSEQTVIENSIPLVVARTECDLLGAENKQSNDSTRCAIETYIKKRNDGSCPVIFIDVSSATGEGVANLGPLLVKHGRESTRIPITKVTEDQVRERLDRERRQQPWYSKLAGLVRKEG